MKEQILAIIERMLNEEKDFLKIVGEDCKICSPTSNAKSAALILLKREIEKL